MSKIDECSEVYFDSILRQEEINDTHVVYLAESGTVSPVSTFMDHEIINIDSDPNNAFYAAMCESRSINCLVALYCKFACDSIKKALCTVPGNDENFGSFTAVVQKLRGFEVEYRNEELLGAGEEAYISFVFNVDVVHIPSQALVPKFLSAYSLDATSDTSNGLVNIKTFCVNGDYDSSSFYDSLYHEVSHMFDAHMFMHKSNYDIMDADDRKIYNEVISKKLHGEFLSDTNMLKLVDAWYRTFWSEQTAVLNGLYGELKSRPLTVSANEVYIGSECRRVILSLKDAYDNALPNVSDETIHAVFKTDRSHMKQRLSHAYKRLLTKATRVLSVQESLQEVLKEHRVTRMIMESALDAHGFGKPTSVAPISTNAENVMLIGEGLRERLYEADLVQTTGVSGLYACKDVVVEVIVESVSKRYRVHVDYFCDAKTSRDFDAQVNANSMIGGVPLIVLMNISGVTDVEPFVKYVVDDVNVLSV